MFTNAKTVMINNKEVQSITTSNGGVLYERIPPMSLILSSDKNVIQNGETATLTATLTENNVGVSGETIYFDGIINTTPTTLTITNSETKVSSKYDVLTVPDLPETLYLNNEKNIELFKFDGMIALTMLVNGQRTTIGQDISNIFVNNGILSYTEDDSIETVDISSYDLSVVSCSNDATATIGDYGYYAVTDGNGVATISYVGKGAGVLNIQGKYLEDSLSSEVCGVVDCLFYNDINEWFNQANRITPVQNVDGSTTLNNSSGTNGFYLANMIGTPKTAYVDVTDWNLGSCVEFDVISTDVENQVQLYDYVNTNSSIKTFSDLNVTGNNHVKIVVANDGAVTYQVDDNTPISATSQTDKFAVGFRVNNNKSITFDNFMIYPI